MFEVLLWAAVAIIVAGILYALDGSKDVFHPLIFIGPMMLFIYAWMPFRLLQADALARFFDGEQLVHVQTLNVCGILAFVLGCLSAGVKVKAKPRLLQRELSGETCRRLLIGSAVLGTIGLACWLITIVNVGGFVNAFSASYSGGWDDSGYIRDGALMLLIGVLLAISSLAGGGPRLLSFVFIVVFGSPWLAQALLTARRGPTFAFIAIVMMGWYLSRRKRPPIVAAAAAGLAVGWLVLFLVTNRGSIYLGSDFDMKTDISDVVEKPDTGNEYVYGSGSVLSAERRDHYFWMKRYLAEILVRPIPSAIWPTKYQDFGVPELLLNAGTGEGFGDALGWVGAVGSAPGIIADLFVEVWWLAVPAMAGIGWCYAWVWKKAVTLGGGWNSQYVILSALSIYLVMQTGEAVIFRVLMLSLPCWLVWKWALRAPVAIQELAGSSSPATVLAARSVQRA